MQSAKSKPESGSLWQHPYVDVFKHFKITPNCDWKSNKKQGDVTEIFVSNSTHNSIQAKEIGRKAISISGSISANNYIQIPHPNSLQKTLNLSGRYVYIELMSQSPSNPFTLHFDMGMADRTHNVRISLSNLFKNFNTSNGFAVQVPLELEADKWTIVVLDLCDILKRSSLFPSTFKIEGSHSLKSMMLCANLQIRGIYTSDNLYEQATMPSDMTFKMKFDLSRWDEFFKFQSLPSDWENKSHSKQQKRHKYMDEKEYQREEERKKMSMEIDELLQRNKHTEQKEEEEEERSIKKSRVGILPEMNKELFDDDDKVQGYVERPSQRNNKVSLAGLQSNKQDYVSGSYIGADLKRSPKLNVDPILELKHIVGYSAEKCLNLKWSKHNDNTVIFTSGATLIAMETEHNEQKRFYFGHSAPICCFDINATGALIASAQEGKNSIIRIWEYESGRCISMVIMPVNTLKCLAFSHDGKFLASSGKDEHNREIVIIWDISRIAEGQKPEKVAKQTSDFNILCLKFSPIDSTRLASCGKENIRFWRIKNNGSIRGSAVVLNHHARNTVFTSLDFEYGFKSSDPKENESLKRLFVASKHGMVFQVNYHTESLEATYQTNDAAIYSIAVNEAFCVTGSEDTYLRVWPLDFSEYYMQAKHEGTVSAVDISPDGLKVVCGTLYGSLGILDKSNQRYRTLIRSHTGDILDMDFHAGKKSMVTVSRDKTIRLWDVETFDQVYEFNSPIDQALCVAAHSTMPIFACGFESGVMRIFDIERTCVADEFSQFNKPLMKMAYSPSGEFLVTCCIDGGIAIHNAKRQHLPIKMMHLEFPPQLIHVAFNKLLQNYNYEESVDENSDPNMLVQNERFAVMGEYGNSVNIFETNSFLIKHQIQAHHILRSFQFANNNRDLVALTTDCRVRFYSLSKYEGIFLRELSSVHRGNVMSVDVSSNNGYMVTGGDDNMIKVWDYEAQKTMPFYFQSFIGHTYAPKNLIFNPNDNTMVISAGEKDGIYVWNFYGDTKSQFVHAAGESSDTGKRQMSAERKSQSMLERMRTTRKEIKQNSNLSEFSFILPTLKQLQSVDKIIDELVEDKQQVDIQRVREEKKLSYNHYQACSKKHDITIDSDTSFSMYGDKQSSLTPVICNGYDGFGGVHDNIVCNQEEGWYAYTLNNKVIYENTRTREQQLMIDSTVQLSTLAISPDKSLLAVGEGIKNKAGNSLICIYDNNTRKLKSSLTFHQEGIQSLCFSNDSQHLISVSVKDENFLAIWSLEEESVISHAIIKGYCVNQVKVDPYIDEDHIQFCTVGNFGLFTFWRLALGQNVLQQLEVIVSEEYKHTNFTSVAYTQYLPSPSNSYLVMVGCSDGSMTAYDPVKEQFVDNGVKKWCISGEIGLISYKHQSVVIASSSGTLAKYQVSSTVFPQDNNSMHIQKTDAAIVALCMDELNQEGLVGTQSGSVYYVNFTEKVMVKLISTGNQIQQEINIAKINNHNPALFITNSTPHANAIKLWATSSVDQVMKMGGPMSPVKFVITNPMINKFTLIGHENGIIKVVSMETLRQECQYQISLAQQEELAVAVYNPNGINFAIGTSQGTVYFGSIKEDSQGKARLLIGKIDCIVKGSNVSITSMQFSQFDPIGCFLVAFSNGLIKTWQSSCRNEQLLRIVEMQKEQRQMNIDLNDCGYQQFDLLDTFNMFENPHGIEEMSDQERNQLLILYQVTLPLQLIFNQQNKKYSHCGASFAPGTTQVDLYFSFVSSLQYIYQRNYISRNIVKRISLMSFPTTLFLLDFNSFSVEDNDKAQGGENVLACIGTKEGNIQMYRISAEGQEKITETKNGLSYGAITAMDVNQESEKLVAGNAIGEIFVFDLMSQMKQ